MSHLTPSDPWGPWLRSWTRNRRGPGKGPVYHLPCWTPQNRPLLESASSPLQGELLGRRREPALSKYMTSLSDQINCVYNFPSRIIQLTFINNAAYLHYAAYLYYYYIYGDNEGLIWTITCRAATLCWILGVYFVHYVHFWRFRDFGVT